jgi:hypothetical protein
LRHELRLELALADVAFVIENGQAVREVSVGQGVSRELVQRPLLPAWAGVPSNANALALRRLLGAPPLWLTPVCAARLIMASPDT